MRVFIDWHQCSRFAFCCMVALSMNIIAELVTPDEFLTLMCDVRFLRTSRLTGVMGNRYFYTEVAPEDIYPKGHVLLIPRP